MARSKKDETQSEAPAEETQTTEAQNDAADSGDAGEKAPGETGDVIDARLQMQEQDDDAVDNDDEADAGVDEEFDKDAEAEAQQANVLGNKTGGVRFPSQDELNPAYAAPAKQDESATKE